MRISSVVLRSYCRTHDLTCQGVRGAAWRHTPMDPEDIANQHELLAVHRRTLAHLLKQAAYHGGIILAPPQVAHGIREARAAIAKIKVWLRDQGETVDDAPGDESGPEEVIPPRLRTAVRGMKEYYTAVFGGRDNQLAALDSFLASGLPYALLLAPTGRGKTALLIHWLARVQAAGNWHVIFTPISIRFGTASAEIFYGAIASALADLHHERDLLAEYRQTPEDLRAIVADYLRRALPDDRRLLLVIDGLDEAIGWQIGRDLFPRAPGQHLCVIVSARQLANTTRADWLDQLGWRAAQTATVDLPGLDRAAVSDILRRMGDPLAKLSTDVDLLAGLADVSQGDPLTIRFLVEALQDGTLAPIRLTELPPGLGLESYIKDWLAELRRGAQAAPVYELLALCAVALGPLTSADLQALAPGTFARLAVLQEAAATVARFIIGDGSEASGYVFSHPRLRELFLEKLLSEHERADLQQRFVTYGQTWYNQHLRTIAADSQSALDATEHAIRNTQHLPAYLRQFWVAHLALVEQWDLARAVLTGIIPIGDRSDQPWATARYAAEGSYAGYLADLDRLWAYAEGRAESQDDVALGVRCALLVSSIRSLSGNLSPELLVGLVTVGTREGKWSPAAALEYVRQMPDANRQARSLMALLDGNCGVPQVQMLEVARTIADEEARAEVLQALAPQLPHDLLAEALAAARTITTAEARAQALQALAPQLPPTEQLAVYAEALAAARTISDKWPRAQALQALAPQLPPTEQLAVYAEALAAARTIAAEGWARAEVLQALAPQLPPELYAEALAAARAITNDWPRAQALQALAPQLPPELYAEALAAARAISGERPRAETLQALAPQLPPTEQLAVYAEALAVTRTITDGGTRAQMLQALAPQLPTELYAEAMTAARAITDEWARAQALQALAPQLPPTEQLAVYAEALTVARTITDEGMRAGALQALAPQLPPELVAEALAAVRAIRDERERTRALQALAPQLARASDTIAVYPASPWHTTLRTLATRGRPAFLRDLAALMPWLAALASPEELKEIAIAIRDVARCWP